MKRKEELQYLGDIRKRFIKHPRHQYKIGVSAGEAMGSVTVAWYRGRHKGILESYQTLKKKYPEAAKYLLDCFNMNAKGSIGFK